jgi:hypothetical protein
MGPSALICHSSIHAGGIFPRDFFGAIGDPDQLTAEHSGWRSARSARRQRILFRVFRENRHDCRHGSIVALVSVMSPQHGVERNRVAGAWAPVERLRPPP